MKKSLHLVVIVVTLCFSHLVKAQTYNGDLMLETQEQVDNFNYTEVRGSLSIWGYSSITNLSGLNGLVRVDGNFGVSYCNSLVNLDGLETLEHVGGQINVNRNENLNDLSGFSAVNYVGGHIYFSSNPSLEEISGFESMITASNEAYLQIGFSNDLKRITGFQNMKDIHTIRISDCDDLESITGFSSLEKVNVELSLWGCAKLKDISGLSNITEVEGEVLIGHNDSLKFEDFQVFCSLFGGATPPTSVSIRDNADNPTPEEIVAACSTTNVVYANAEQEMLVYPNPFKNYLMVECNNFIELTLVNQAGKAILKSQQNRIETAHLPAGIYIVLVKTEDRNYQYKLVK